jgi:hypothetical protein
MINFYFIYNKMSTDDVNSLIRGLENLNIKSGSPKPKRKSGSPKPKRKSGSPKPKRKSAMSGITAMSGIATSGILMTAKISGKVIMFIAKIIITVLNESSIHLSDNFITYIILVTQLSYCYITYLISGTGTYSRNELDNILNEFVESIRVLFDTPRKNLKLNKQDIERCFQSAGTESVFSYIGLTGDESKKNVNQLRSLKAKLESTTVNISDELFKIKNDIESRYVNNILLSFSIIKNEIKNIPETINTLLKKYLGKATTNAEINVESLSLLEPDKDFQKIYNTVMSIGYKDDEPRNTMMSIGEPRNTMMSIGEPRNTMMSIGEPRNTMMSIGYRKQENKENSYNPIMSLGYKKLKNIKKISNALQIPEVNLESLISMVAIESNIPFDNTTIFDEDSICGRTSRRILNDFNRTTTNELTRISTLAHEKLAENEFYLQENYEYIQLILVITLIPVFSLLLNKGLRTLLSCCVRKDGIRSSRKRRTSKRKSMKQKSKRKSMKQKSKRKSMKRKSMKQKSKRKSMKQKSKRKSMKRKSMKQKIEY